MKDKKGKILVIILLVILILGLLFWYAKNTFLSELVFNVKESNIELRVGDKYTLNYELNKDISIKWESDDTSIASIDKGVVTAVSLGNTTVKGTVTKGDKTITKTCMVSTYLGDKEVSLNDIIIDGEIVYITASDSYNLPIEYSPNNAFISDISYRVDDPSILDFDGKITAKTVGKTNITITVNNVVTKTISAKVISRKINPVLSQYVKEVNIDEENIILKLNETKDIKYTIIPKNAFVENVKWSSSDSSIVSVDSGLIKAKAPGEAVITLLVNDTILKEVKVKVSVPVTGLSLTSSPKLVMKVGNKETIKTSISPQDATNKKLIYTNNNTSSIKVSDSGEITALGPGSGTIIIKTEDGNYTVSVSYTVNKKNGVINNAAGVWGYTSPRDKTPTKAGANFFKNIASKGKGTFSNNTYIYSDGKNTYKYDLSSSRLYVNNQTILTRIYYPEGVDLSSVNTYTFFGGSGERNFGGYFSHLDSNLQEMSSSGIVILVSATNSYKVEDGIYATQFVKSIVGQKSGVINTVGGYSMSGNAAGKALTNGNYNRLVIFNSCIDNIATDDTKNKEIVFYSPVGDSFTSQTINTIVKMTRAGYTNITVVSNNKAITENQNVYTNNLVINPGEQMGKGHGYVNISKARVFAYANR